MLSVKVSKNSGIIHGESGRGSWLLLSVSLFILGCVANLIFVLWQFFGDQNPFVIYLPVVVGCFLSFGVFMLSCFKAPPRFSKMSIFELISFFLHSFFSIACGLIGVGFVVALNFPYLIIPLFNRP